MRKLPAFRRCHGLLRAFSISNPLCECNSDLAQYSNNSHEDDFDAPCERLTAFYGYLGLADSSGSRRTKIFSALRASIGLRRIGYSLLAIGYWLFNSGSRYRNRTVFSSWIPSFCCFGVPVTAECRNALTS